MKKLISTVVASLLFVTSMATPMLVRAESTPASSPTTTETAEAKASRATRVEAYKKALAVSLSEAVKTRIAARCVAAQALVKAHITRSSAAITARNAIYDKILTSLATTADSIGSEGVDNTTLKANIETLKTMVADFKAKAETYSQSLSDVAALDCKTDPAAFKAALETARTNQAAALKSAKDIRTYVTVTIKATLKALTEAAAANAASPE